MTHVISASTGVNWIRLILDPPYFLDKHDDLFFFFLLQFLEKDIGREHERNVKINRNDDNTSCFPTLP